MPDMLGPVALVRQGVPSLRRRVMRVLITGGTGTLGHAIVPKLFNAMPSLPPNRGYYLNSVTPVIFSRDEYKQSQMQREFPDAEYILGDVRDPSRVFEAAKDCGAIIHAAALKRIEVGEKYPSEFIETNVLGSKHVAQVAHDLDIPSILVSSDKAVYPINTYGMTKALAEKLFLSNGLGVVRYGNVLGSRGSLLEVIDKCVEEGKPIPITDPRMTRFWWRVEDAADFVIKHMLEPGLHIPDLKGRKVVDIIAERVPGHPTVEVGIQAGEKMHEWLETTEENWEARSSGDFMKVEG